MDKLKYKSNVSYYSVSSGNFEEDEQPLRPHFAQFELGDHPQLARRRTWPVTLLIQILCGLWLLPIVTLLYLNLSGKVIGPTAWCVGDNCRVDAFNNMLAIPQNNIARFNKNDHNLLGGLQLVAKALEIWFIAIAAAFVYLVTMHLASKPGGLPIGYLTRPTEFAEFLNLFDPLLWKTGPSPLGSSHTKNKVGQRAWFLIILSVTLCLLCNLMGPATAVLAIPSLQWIGTKHIESNRFSGLNAQNPPGVDPGSWFSNVAAKLCTTGQLQSRNYSCTLDTVGHSLDAWLDSYLSSGGNLGFTQQWDLAFQVNSTARFSSTVEKEQLTTNFAFWIPSRQILTNMSDDRSIVKDISQGWNVSSIQESQKKTDQWIQPTDPVESYVEYNRSLALQLQRTGPVTGFIPTFWFGQYNSVNKTMPWTINIANDKMVRCYNAYLPGLTPMVNWTANIGLMGAYLKCIRVGSGWSDLNKAASFYVPDVFDSTSATSKQDQAQSLGVEVTVYSSDRAVFFPNATLPDWLPTECIVTSGNLTRPGSCDWERLFSEPAPAMLENRTTNLCTTEFYMSDGKDNAALLASDFVAFHDFTTYSLDVSPSTNPLRFARTHELPLDVLTSRESIHVDPNWILAGWSVADGGDLQLGRSSGTALLQVMKSYYEYGFQATYWGDTSWNWLSLSDYITFLPVAHALSLIDHKLTSITDAVEPDSKQPILYRTAQMYVWGYFMASRTAIMGVVVTSFGCVIVLMQLYLGARDRRRYRSPTQLLIAALEHMPRGEFEGRRHNETAMARVPFHIDDHDTRVLRFTSLSGQGGAIPGQTRYSPAQFSPWQGGGSRATSATSRTFVW